MNILDAMEDRIADSPLRREEVRLLINFSFEFIVKSWNLWDGERVRGK